MKFNRIKLQDVGPHELTDIELGDGLIGVFGPQGSGKSTLFNLAYAALTNDYSRIEGNKEGAVRQQADKKEPSRIEVWAEHGGSKFHLMRRLAPSSAHSLIVNEQPAIKKAGEIQQMLEGVLGVDRQTLDRYVFVEQWGLRALFQSTETERAKTLAHLCNTRHAETCWELVGKQLEADLRLAAEVDDNTDELRAKIGSHRHELTKLTNEIADWRPKLLTAEELQAIKQRQTDRHRREWLEIELPQRQADEAELLEAAKRATRDRKDAVAALEVHSERLDAAKRSHQAAANLVADYDRRVKAWEAQQDLFRERDRLERLQQQTSPADPDVLSGPTVEELTTRGTELTEQLAPLTALLNQSHKLGEGESVCPTCGQSIESLQEQLRAAKEKAKPLAAELKRLQSQLSARREQDRLQSQFESRQQAYLEQLQQLQARLSTEPALPAPGSSIEAGRAEQEAKTNLALAQREFDQANRRLAAAADARSAAVAKHVAMKTTVEKLTQELATLADVDGSSVAGDELLLAAHQESREKLAALQSSLQFHETLAAEAEQELKRIELLLSRSRKARQWVTHLQKVRNAFHRDSLPRLVHHDALASMENGINEMLETFESPFRVTTSDDLSYVAHFRNGTVMPAKGLSGGQQVVLALAFRWVLNSLFAGQIGMMVLDEPTAGLDRRHVDLLETALRALGAEARSRGCQVILVTHELSLEPVFDQVIKLGKAVA